MARWSVACDSEWKCRMAVAKNRKLLAARGMSSDRASRRGLPVSTHSAQASFSRFASIRSAIRRRRAERCTAGVRHQAGKAFSAASTERSTSRSSPSGTREYAFPVAGSRLSRYRWETGSTSSPLI